MSAEREREMYQRRMRKEGTQTMVLPGGINGDEASKGSKGSDDHVTDPTGEGDGDPFTESDDEAKNGNVTRGDQLSLKSKRKAARANATAKAKAVLPRGKSRGLKKLKSVKKKAKASGESQEWENWRQEEWAWEEEWDPTWDDEDWDAWEEEEEIKPKSRAKPGPKPKGKSIPKAKASPKSKAKAKAKAKASATKHDPAKPKAKAKQVKPKPTEEVKPVLKRKRGKTPEHEPETDSPNVTQLKKKLLTFVGQHSGREMDAAFKKELREVCQGPLVNSSLNIYWKRPACGVTCKSLSKDFGYYYFKADGVDFLDRLLLACKAGHEIVFQKN
ncbi:unnamed protein product [Symbiodinium sp. CCMP2592]|nr:unnamed protein product [Symbiodinium sp. CCMP2592]